jgi:peptidoglycan-associated lipoprotein
MNRLSWARLLAALCVVLLIAGCGSKGGTEQKGGATVESRDLGGQQGATEEQRAADAKRAEEERKRQEAEARRLADEKRKADEAALRAAEQPVVKPLPSATVGEKALSDAATQLKDTASPLSKRSVYYDFDMYNIRDEFQPIVEAHAKFLLEHKELKVRVEGNCDERGSREYNLALGQRRADSIKRAMTLLGVPAKQIETVSFGAEKPKAPGHDEEAWAENRRSDIVYIGIDSPQ